MAALIKLKIKEIAEKLAKELEFELVDIEWKRENQELHIVIYIYHPKGINLDDCTLYSQAIDSKLESLKELNESYYLEVSSPGLDRLLKTADDYRRNLGKLVELKLYAAKDGKKEILGVLKNYTDKVLIIEAEHGETEIPITSISTMRQAIVL